MLFCYARNHVAEIMLETSCCRNGLQKSFQGEQVYDTAVVATISNFLQLELFVEVFVGKGETDQKKSCVQMW